MQHAHAADVLLVSLGSTEGLRRADDELQDSLRRAGARVAVARPFPPEPVPTLMLTDLAWARAARQAAGTLMEQMHRAPPRAVIYSSTTAALLWPRPGAIRFDATAAGNRPGAPRPVAAPARAPAPAPGAAAAPVERGRPAGGAADRSRGAIARSSCRVPSSPPGRRPRSATSPRSPTPRTRPRRASTACSPAWRSVRAELSSAERSTGPPEELFVAGATAEQLEQAGLIAPGEEGVRVVGSLIPREFRALLRRARVFVCAPRREDYGIAQLEALADGCQLVTTPAPGPYAALPIARRLDPRLVGEDLAGALRGPLCAIRSPATASVRSRSSCRSAARRSTGWWPSSYFRACLRSCCSSGQVRVLTTSSRVSHARRAVATPQRMF